MSIYIDVILIENICMNYIILMATSMILKKEIRYFRIFISAFIGAIYAIIGYMQILGLYSSMTSKIILSIIMVYISFSPPRIKVLLKELLVFYLTSFVFGGVAFSLLYIIRPQDILINNGVLIGTYPIKIAFLGAIVGFVILNITFKIVKNRVGKKDIFCNIEVQICNNVFNVKALIDTGNLLKDPISQMPVMVVEKECLYEIIPRDILDNIISILGGDRLGTDTVEQNPYMAKIRIIPFTSLGKQNGMLIGIKSDYIKLEIDGEQIIRKDVIIGIYQDKLTKNGLYKALIGLDILDKEETGYYESTRKDKIKY